jgi:acetyl esterase/lipase
MRGRQVIDQRLIDEPAFAAEADAYLTARPRAGAPGAQDPLAAMRGRVAGPEVAGEPDPGIRWADLFLPARGGPVPVRVYAETTVTEPRPLLLWLHGGGFVAGSVRDLDHVCSRLARLAGVTVVSLEYRLAPEHPYPAALHDTVDALSWLAAHGSLLGGDGKLAAGGLSAGAALVAGASLVARDQRDLALTYQVLCYPALDFGQDTESVREFNGVLITVGAGSWPQAAYLGGQQPDSYAAPLRAPSLAGLPPVLLIGAGRDPLRDDARGYARRLDADGVQVTYVEYAGVVHGFLNACGVLSAGDHAINVIAAELRRVHAPAPVPAGG